VGNTNVRLINCRFHLFHSSASSFGCQYLLLFLKSSKSCVLLLPTTFGFLYLSNPISQVPFLPLSIRPSSVWSAFSLPSSYRILYHSTINPVVGVWFFAKKKFESSARNLLEIVVPSFSLEWKSDESTNTTSLKMLLAINWHCWQARGNSRMHMKVQGHLMKTRFI